MVYPHDPENGFFNPDSVKMYICDSTENSKQLFAKKYFEIIFYIDPFHLPQFVEDTTITLTIVDIDSSMTELKSSFYCIDSLFGEFKFIKMFPNIIDTNKLASYVYLIEFINEVKIDSIIIKIKEIVQVFKIDYIYRSSHTLSILNDPSFTPGKGHDVFYKEGENIIEPENPNGYLFTHGGTTIYPEGYEWSQFEISLPLAWELTKGKKSVILGIHDDFWEYGGVLITTKYDEFLFFDGIQDDDHRKFIPFSKIPNSNVNILQTTEEFNHRHGAGVSSTAITNGNNNKGISGVSPGCSFVTTIQDQPTINPKNYSLLDLSTDNGIQTIDLLNYSNTTAGSAFSIDLIKSGIAMVAGVGNEIESSGLKDLKPEITDFDVWIKDLNNINYKYSIDHDKKLIAIKYFPPPCSPANNAFYDNITNSIVKVLGVGSIGRDIKSTPCVNWDPRINLEIPSFPNLNYSSDLNSANFISHFVYSEGIDPFSNNVSETVRLSERKKAQIDVAAPGLNILSLREDGLMYAQQTGSSYATPQVSGIVALMRSIDKLMNLSITQPTKLHEQISDGAPIHKKIYDIITFTADKIVDNEAFLSDTKDSPQSYNKEFTSGSHTGTYNVFLDFPPFIDDPNSRIKFEYLVQENDQLKRSWAQRVGFGKVNAYRAVAHSIRNKGLHEYTETRDLVFTPSGEGNENENNQKLMHFGAYNSDGQLVLEHGGNKYEGQPDYNNSHGTTKINGFETELIVPNNCILAIDGILKQDQATKSNNKILTTGTGKILTTGFMKNVELSGLVKTDDLEIHSSNQGDDGFGRIIFINNIGVTDNSEIYGKVNIHDNSYIQVGNGIYNETENPLGDDIADKLIIQPGGEIKLKGTKDIHIKDKATLEMAYASAIIDGNPSEVRKIIIESGGTLKIQKGAACTLDVKIEIMPGGKMEFEENTLAWIDEIKLMGTNSQLILANNDNSGANVGCWLLPANNKSGKVIIMPGAELNVYKSIQDANFKVKEVAIIGGVDIHGTLIGEPPYFYPVGGTLNIKESTTFDVGPINADPYTTIRIEPKSEITLYAPSLDNNGIQQYCGLGYSECNINGKIYIGYNTTEVADKINIKGLQGENKFMCNDKGDENYVFAIWKLAGVPAYAIFPEYFLTSIQNTDFYNITIKNIYRPVSCVVNNLPFEGIYNCKFAVNSKIFTDANIKNYFPLNRKPNTILDMITHFPGYYEVPPTGFQNLNLTKCKFQDYSQQNITWLQGGEIGNDVYKSHFYGLNVYGYNDVTIDNSTLPQYQTGIIPNDDQRKVYQFDNLNCGISTVNCSRVTVTNSSFDFSIIGHKDHNSTVKLCNNTSFRVNVPHSLNGSKFWSTFNNKFHQSNKSTNLIGVLSGQNFRGNLFDDYFNGILMEQSRAYLRGKETGVANEIREPIGRNEFNILELTVSNRYPDNIEKNPFVSGNKFNPQDGSRSDFSFVNYPSTTEFENKSPLKIQCGYNQMGEYTPGHLFYADEVTQTLDKIKVCPNVNDWRINGVIRFDPNKITIVTPNNDLTSSQDRIASCGEPTEEVICSPLVPIVGNCDFFARNTGIWAMFAPTDTILLNDFNATLNDFCNGMLNCECLKVRLFDLMQLATLCDSSDAKIQMVIDCILDKLDDPIYANCDLPGLAVRLGEAYERRGQFEDALDQYYYTLYNSQNSSDTTLARWRIMNIEAFQTDTTFGFVYDSLMMEYYARVDRDITKVYIGGGSPPPPPRVSAGNEQELDEWNQPINDITPLGELEQNVPNPFSNETVIRFRLNKEADVRLGIHDNLGQTIKVIIQQRMKPGNYVYTYINEGLGSGVYLYLLTTDGKQYSKKMQLVK
jgi:hypothetical protein